MIEKMVWTIILLSLIAFASILNWADLDSGDLLNFGAVLGYFTDFIKEFINLFYESKRDIWSFLENLILTALFITPFIFVWRGTFFFKVIPTIGFIFRILLMLTLIFLPWISNYFKLDSAETIFEITELTIFVVAIFGIWMPKSWTK